MIIVKCSAKTIFMNACCKLSLGFLGYSVQISNPHPHTHELEVLNFGWVGTEWPNMQNSTQPVTRVRIDPGTVELCWSNATHNVSINTIFIQLDIIATEQLPLSWHPHFCLMFAVHARAGLRANKQVMEISIKQRSHNLISLMFVKGYF